MKTPEQVFNQIAAGELLCPCGLKCRNAPLLKRLPRPDDTYDSSMIPKHESYDELLDCITNYTRVFIYQRIQALRSHATQNLKLPFETFRIFPANEGDPYDTAEPSQQLLQKLFRKAVIDCRLHFSSNVIELDNRIETYFFSICDSVISQTKANEKTA